VIRIVVLRGAPLLLLLLALLACRSRLSPPKKHAKSKQFEAIAVAVNATHTCLLAPDGVPRCFGGDDSRNPPMTAAPRVALSRLATGRRFACGIRASDGGVVCWGDCGNDPRRCAAPAGKFEDLALDDDSGGCAWSASPNAPRVACWGQWTAHRSPPSELFAASLAQLSFGTNWAVARRTDGTLLAWGREAVAKDPLLQDAIRRRRTFSNIGGRGALLCLIDAAGRPSCITHHGNTPPPGVAGRAIAVDASNPRGAMPACVLVERAGERSLHCTKTNKARRLPLVTGSILSFGAGDDHVCVLRAGSRVECFGDDLYGRVTGRTMLGDADWP
jgi:hypothetical protein